jgi:hypothetical protein
MDIKIPEPVGLPQAVPIPGMPLAMPQLELPKWEPVPIYRDDVPALNPQTSPQDQSSEEEKESNSQQQPPERDPEEGIPADVLDMVDEVRFLSPPVQPFPWEEREVETVETIELPGGFEVPIPKQEIMVTAVTTAGAASVVSVGATMVAGDLFKRIVQITKPLIKVVLKRVAKFRKKAPPLSWSRQRLASRQHKSGRNRCRDGS